MMNIDIANIVENQRIYFEQGETRDLNFRKKQLRKLKLAIRANEKRIMEALKKDLGKSYTESYLTEIGVFYQEIKYILSNLNRLAKDRKVSTPFAHFPSKSKIIYDPYGVVLIIAPWNYPFQLVLHPLIGAIAGGNCAIIKPSEISSHSSRLIAEILDKIFEEEYIKVVEGEKEVSQKLLDEDFDYVFFTGSSRVGQIVLESCSKKLIPVTLELGGKSPCIVDRDVDVDLAAKRILWGKLLNAGQTCVAPDYLFVHEDIREEFIESSIKWIEKFYGKFPLENPEFPYIINEKHFLRLKEVLDKENILFGGNWDEEKRKIAPTIVEGNWESPAMKEEIFGPILPIHSYQNIEEIPKILKRKAKPLALYIFTNSKDKEEYILRECSFGCGAVNDVVIQVSSAHLPFGGVGHSGMGSYHGDESFYTFTHKKGILKKSNTIDIPLRYPPFKGKLNQIKKILK